MTNISYKAKHLSTDSWKRKFPSKLESKFALIQDQLNRALNNWTKDNNQGRVVRKPINTNPWL